MTVNETQLPGVWILEPTVFGDVRGYFMESYNTQQYAALGIGDVFVQDNHSHSTRDVVRGLHYQLRHPQAKLCYVARGEVLDVVVDIRRGSPTFGQWTAERLTAESGRQIYIPRGFAHGFRVLSDVVDFIYKCDDYYYPDDDRGIAWNDPDLAIDWRLADPILSAKDRELPCLADVAEDALPVLSG